MARKPERWAHTSWQRGEDTGCYFAPPRNPAVAPVTQELFKLKPYPTFLKDLPSPSKLREDTNLKDSLILPGFIFRSFYVNGKYWGQIDPSNLE